MTTAVAHWLSSLIILFIFVVMLFLIVPFPSVSLVKVNCSIEHEYFLKCCWIIPTLSVSCGFCNGRRYHRLNKCIGYSQRSRRPRLPGGGGRGAGCPWPWGGYHDTGGGEEVVHVQPVQPLLLQPRTVLRTYEHPQNWQEVSYQNSNKKT